MNKPFLPDDHPHTRAAALSSLTKAMLLVARQAVDRSVRSEDRDVGLILRAASVPHSTSNTAALAVVMKALVAALRPVSAAAEVIARSLQLDFDRAAQLTVPSVSIAPAAWVGEGAAIPVLTGNSLPGPTLNLYKLATIVGLTNELANSSNAEAIMRQLLLESVGPALDAAMFSSGAGTPGVQPPGILNGIAAQTAEATLTGIEAMAKDLGTIAGALAASAGGSTPILVASPARAISLSVLSMNMPWPVFASPAVPATSIIGIVPAGLATVVEVPRLEASNTSTEVYANPANSDLAAGAPVASIFQTDKISLRLIMPATWAVRSPTAVAWMTGVKW